jgi:hypothetical protein
MQDDSFEKALRAYKNRSNYFEILQEKTINELETFRKSGFSRVRILCGPGCESCKSKNNIEYSIDQALKKMPIPNKECTFELYIGHGGWCRCLYQPILD